MKHKEKNKYWNDCFFYIDPSQKCNFCNKKKYALLEMDIFTKKEKDYICHKCFMKNQQINKITEFNLEFLRTKYLLNNIKKLEKLKDSQMKSLNKIGKNINSKKTKGVIMEIDFRYCATNVINKLHQLEISDFIKSYKNVKKIIQGDE